MEKEKIIKKLNNLKKFDKSKRSTFPYWYNHWKAYNLTALLLEDWKFKYLFHDIEKPWLRLIFPYEVVQKFHRKNSNHHIEYKKGYNKIDWMGLYIDWFCGRYTKYASNLTVKEEASEQIKKHPNYKDVIDKYLSGYILYYNDEDNSY